MDYRALNKVLVHDAAPVPRVDAVIDAVADGRPVKFFTKIDLQRGYWQAPLSEKSAYLTAFSTPDGHFEYVRLPMGLQMAPAAFNRELSIVLQPLPWVAQYFDDLYFASETLDEHREKLAKLLGLMRDHSLTINVEKSLFAVDSVPILGFYLDADGLRPDPDKVAAMRAHADNPPRTVKELQSFLGSVNYYGKLIQDGARIAAPLYALTRKDAVYEWSSTCDAAYRRLIDILTSAPVLRLPDMSKPFTVATDASGLAVGAVLSQVGDDGQEHPIAYASRTLNRYEIHYGITEKECLAVVWAVKAFRVYLHDTKFTVVTDHAALQWLMDMRDPVGRLARWGLYLQSHDFKIVFRPGRLHANADLLSRPAGGQGTHNRTPDPAGREMAAAANGNEPLGEQLAAVAADGDGEHIARVMAVLRSATRPRTTPTPTMAYVDEIPEAADEPAADETVRTHLGRDVTDDPALLHYVQHGRHLEGQSRKQVSRVEHLARDYVWADGMLHKDGAGGRRIVPPTAQRWQLVQQAHYTGHFDARATYSRLKEQYTWPGMLADATAAAHTCTTCLRAGTQAAVFHPPAKSIASTGVWDLISVDTQWGLPETDRGYCGLLVIIDHLSRYPVVFPLRTKTQEEIARRLWTFIALFGPPKALLSDNGTEFLNTAVNDLSTLHGIDRRVTAPYHPNTNGQVENVNRTLAMALRKLAIDDPIEWDRHLDSVLYAYRTRVHSTTGLTPYSLVFGRPANGLVSYKGGPGLPEPSVDDRLTELTQLQHLVTRAIGAEQAVQQGQRRRTDSSHNVRHKPIPIGTVVYVRLGHKVMPKMMPRFLGPFTVTRVDRAGNYRLRSKDGIELDRAVPLPRLRVVNTDGVPNASDIVAGMPSATDLYDVEEILRHRSHRGYIEYLVKWYGYSSADATWEQEGQFVDTTPLSQYWASLAKSAEPPSIAIYPSLPRPGSAGGEM